MKSVGKSSDYAAAGGFACQPERRFNRMGSRRAGELHAVGETSRSEDVLAEGAHELPLRRSVQVERVHDAVRHEVFDHAALHQRMVMPVVKRSAGRKEIDIFLPILVPHTRVKAA